MSIEQHFDTTFTARLALSEKQIQQHYRPIIGIHKWFARRPGTVFRNLLLAEFNGQEALEHSYWRAHHFSGVIADPFMGGGTPLFEANRLGFSVVGTDSNPMACWIVRQSLDSLDLDAFSAVASEVAAEIEKSIGNLYQTACLQCAQPADVKYFLWVKVHRCPSCGVENDLFPGYVLAEATRHPQHVLVCGQCGALNEYDDQPRQEKPERCRTCGHMVSPEGPAKQQRATCRNCAHVFRYPLAGATQPPKQRLWAIEYICHACKPQHEGRFFKKPDPEDVRVFEQAASAYHEQADHLPLPENEIPAGDETNRLLRWGYRQYKHLFNERQLLGLGLLLQRICRVEQSKIRHALLTVFSDFLRYQNMLCRYDTYALKCQDIFSVHGFPVGLIHCENNILGIPKIGSGAFRHFVEKYRRAKMYGDFPFETKKQGKKKEIIPITGEKIQAELIQTFPEKEKQQAYLVTTHAAALVLPPSSLDGVFTDPPYFDNVQYAELMDFCFSWIRLGLADEFEAFRQTTTRARYELTGNITLGRGLEHFTAGLSAVFCHYAMALKPAAPFVFTYHHNDLEAYIPLVVAILDAGMDCTATLPAVAEMRASLHIAGTASSVLDTVFVCRRETRFQAAADVLVAVKTDICRLEAATVHLTPGDLRCLCSGHITRLLINRLYATWRSDGSLVERVARVRESIQQLPESLHLNTVMQNLQKQGHNNTHGEETFATII
jgi:adenine-specific DNA methylase